MKPSALNLKGFEAAARGLLRQVRASDQREMLSRLHSALNRVAGAEGIFRADHPAQTDGPK